MVNSRATVIKLQMHSGTLAGFNDDLLIQIFLWLPVISVVRFKSVSKHWQSLLSHPSFTLLYKSVSISLGFFLRNFYFPFDDEKRGSPPFHALYFYPDPFGIKIVQSCNGLLLCCSDCRDKRDCKYYVFNPNTKQFALIPSVPGAEDVIGSMVLAFHQTDCVNYKLVCSVKGNEGLCQIHIYSYDKARWKISNQAFKAGCYTKCFGVYWNQAIYWSCHSMFFKLDTEKLQRMPMPVGLASFKDHQEYFGESGGHLHLAVGSNRLDSHIHVNVYEMLNDHSGWILKYRVELDELLNAYPQMICRITDLTMFFYDFQVLDVVRGEEEDETFIVMRIAKKLVIRYNVADKSSKQISHLSSSLHGLIRFREVHRYIATLISF